jgi:hypothetical protein
MLTVVMVAAAGLGGCQNNFTRPNYDTVYVGQKDWQVQQTLGSPHENFGDRWVYNHDQPYYHAEIAFKDGCVASKSWSENRSSSVSQPAGDESKSKSHKPKGRTGDRARTGTMTGRPQQ